MIRQEWRWTTWMALALSTGGLLAQGISGQMPRSCVEASRMSPLPGDFRVAPDDDPFRGPWLDSLWAVILPAGPLAPSDDTEQRRRGAMLAIRRLHQRAPRAVELALALLVAGGTPTQVCRAQPLRTRSRITGSSPGAGPRSFGPPECGAPTRVVTRRLRPCRRSAQGIQLCCNDGGVKLAGS